VLNITAGVSLREVRTATVSLLLFKIMHSFTKSQQIYLADGEKKVQVFSPVRQRRESLWCCSGGCAIMAAAAKRIKTVVAGLDDHCTDFSFLLGKPLLSHF